MTPQKPEPTPDDAEIRARRVAIRNRALAAREAAPPAQRAAWEVAIMHRLDSLIEKLAPRTLAFYWPFRAEPDCRGWVTRWLAGDATRVAALPVVIERHAPLVFRRWTPETELAIDSYGIAFPARGEEVTPDVALVPLNAFDARGYRLGYGSGYFDRTLAAMRMVTVGIGFELGREDDVLPQPHDRAMEWVVTETGQDGPQNGNNAAKSISSKQASSNLNFCL